MRTLLLLVSLSLAACQGRDESPTSNDHVPMGKAIEPDDDFIQTRASFQAQSRARLERVNTRIDELGREASVHLHALRDQLATHIEKLDERGETEWDRARSDVEHAFDDVERDLNRN